MERVNDVSQIILQDEYILAEVVIKPMSVLQVDDTKPVIDHMIIILTGKNVTRYKTGDIIISTTNIVIDSLENKGKKYCLLPEGFIKIAVHPDNFTPSENKSNLLLN